MERKILLLGGAFSGTSDHLLHFFSGKRNVPKLEYIQIHGHWLVAWPPGQRPKMRKTRRHRKRQWLYVDGHITESVKVCVSHVTKVTAYQRAVTMEETLNDQVGRNVSAS